MIKSVYVRCEVFTAVEVQVDVFWVVTPCSVVRYKSYRSPCSPWGWR